MTMLTTTTLYILKGKKNDQKKSKSLFLFIFCKIYEKLKRIVKKT